MEEQTLEALALKFSDLRVQLDQTLESRINDSEKSEHYSDSMDENKSNDSQEACSDQEQTLPILKKIDDLSCKVQNLRKEHTLLCNEVKSITKETFPGTEVFSALQGISVEHEILKKKYHEECELLKKKYLEEFSERKRLYNEVIELKGNIRVFCRCRPLNQDEIAKGYCSVIDLSSYQENDLQVICSDSSRKQFKFDHVFKPEDSQEDVFNQTLPIVMSVLDGYNVCIFAYGQTGTGKTFTMEGTPENRGVNYRTLEELFKISKDRRSTMKYELSVSMLEVYNEKIRDLLVENSDQPSKRLEIKQSAEGTQEVPGLVEARVHGTGEVWELLKSGSRVRSVGSTNANELSSRSHCLLRVTVTGENLLNGHRTRSHLWLVDLAGSERVGKIEVEGERLKESQFINKSLSALGDVISALASKTSHIPYRNSKLTHILQSSLGGDCKTLMFVQTSPSVADLGETICSLNFATRVRGVGTGPARKQADCTELFKYKQMAEKAKHDEKETKKLQDTVQSLQLRLAGREHISKSLQEKVRDLEHQLAEERKARQKQETRALATVSAQPSTLLSSIREVPNSKAENKPPLAPARMRLPLRRISNFMPQSPVPTYKPRTSLLPVSKDDKENLSRASSTKAATFLPRRGSIAVKPPSQAKPQAIQPKRRASIATFRSESSSNMTTPLNTSSTRLRKDRVMGRQSFVWDPQRVWRTSRQQSPLPQSRDASRATVEGTPAAGSRSSKFMGSPPSQIGSWKPKHPTVVALQRKPLIWSPLKSRGFKTNRRSMLPS
ncbi:Kinesin motor domain-containing protein [Heracleum sosnowskyi]|uniref:Kinesin-like protein n=1 Tax=Heracleum sosnowskyi TaxID=360622 RepID=A0AAD8GPT5_9APIA|nr:Kinesin motor domain-containing protein [Heracleum sosnowskyi]